MSNQRRWLVGLCVMLLLGVTVVLSDRSLASNTVPELRVTVQDDETQEETAEERLKRFRGRLPNYFGRVIDESQREQIYELQARFNEQIDSLEMQIADLTKERNELVEKVLTPEQLAEVNRMREEAKARRSTNRNNGDDSGDNR